MRRPHDDRRADTRLRQQGIATTAIERLKHVGFEVQELDAQIVLVEGRYELYPVLGQWKDRKNSSRLGYTVRRLIDQVMADRAAAAQLTECANCRPAPIVLPPAKP